MPHPPTAVVAGVRPAREGAARPAAVDVWIDRVAPWLAAVVAAAVALALMGRGGPHLSPDSVQYLSVADNLARGHGFTAYDGHALLVWPPGYPLLLAAGGVFSPRHLLGTSEAIGVALAGLMGLLSWRLARRHLGPRTALAVVALVILANEGPVGTAAALWVEPLLIVSTLALILLLERVGGASGTNDRVVIGAGVAGALAGLASYGGDQVVLAALLALVVMPAPDGWHRFRRVLLFGVTAGAPNAAWMTRNLYLSGQVAGPRVPPTYTVRSLAGHLVDLVHRMFFHWCPSRVGTAAAVLTLLLVPALVAAVAVLISRNRPEAERHVPEAAPDRTGSTLRWAALLDPLPLVTLVSTVLLLGSSVVVWVSFDARTLSRLVVPLAVVVAVLVQRVGAAPWARAGHGLRRGVTVVGMAGLLVGLGGMAGGLHDLSSEPRTDYSAPMWAAKGPGLRATVAGARTVWSNQPDIVWKLTGRRAALLPQRKVHFDPRSPAEQLRDFHAAVIEGGAVVVWFDGSSPALRPEPGLLVPRSELEVLFRFEPRAQGPGWTSWNLHPT